MRYENRQPPEGINVETRGWLGDFVLLVVGALAALLLISWLLLQLVAWSAKWMPFSWEQSLTRAWAAPEQPDERLQYLQDLAQALSEAGGLNPDVSLIVRYSPEPYVNAFATLGGNVVIFQGLLDAVDSEQGLAFVMAHELAHIHYRHPAQVLARGMTLGLFSALVFGQTDVAQVAGLGGHLAMLNYSRRQELEADFWAQDALYHWYGHVNGADELFQNLAESYSGRTHGRLPQWLASHPDLTLRIQALERRAQAQGYAQAGELASLPAALREQGR